MDQNTLEIEAKVENLPRVTEFLDENIKELNCSKKELAQIRIVAEEIFVNISSYAYSPGPGRAVIHASPSIQENSILLKFIDSGAPFDPLKEEEPDISKKASERKKGGLGIFYVKRKVDSISYEYSDGKNVLTLKKIFKGDIKNEEPLPAEAEAETSVTEESAAGESGPKEPEAEEPVTGGAEKEEAPTLIVFENVGKIYRTGSIVYEALHDVNLEIKEGELAVLLGPSGAGKSTLLNLLGGLDSATSGKIYFGGEELTAMDDKRLGRFRAKDVGIVFQFYNLVPTLTALENVDLMQDLGVKIMDPLKALDMVGLADRKNNFPSQMSGGQQQRVSIARAIAKMPRLLLCDEPTGALDTNTGREVLKIIQDQSRVHGKTVVMVTHNSLFAEIADKVVYVKNGTIEEITVNDAPKDADEINW